MTTIGDVFSEKSSEKDNNFLILRLGAASLVVYGHAFALAAPCNICQDFASKWLQYRYSGDIGLHIFFVISGFLVSASFDKRKNLCAFLWSRALRIFPALWICLLLMVVVGAFFSSMPANEFYTNGQTWEFLINNFSLYQFVENLPGIFSTSRYAQAANGSLWTLGIEARLYILVAIFGILGWSANRKVSNALIVLMVLIGCFIPSHIPLIGENPNHLRVGAYFAIGVLLYSNRDLIPMSGQVLAMLVLCAALSYGTANYEIAFGAMIAYGVLWFAFTKKIELPRFVHDYSYGIYLYGWPIEQIIHYVQPDLGPYKMVLIALPTAWLAGAISWLFIEKPSMRMKGLLIAA